VVAESHLIIKRRKLGVDGSKNEDVEGRKRDGMEGEVGLCDPQNKKLGLGKSSCVFYHNLLYIRVGWGCLCLFGCYQLCGDGWMVFSSPMIRVDRRSVASSLAGLSATLLLVSGRVAGPQRQVVPEQLHDQRGVLVAVLVQGVQLGDSVVERLAIFGVKLFALNRFSSLLSIYSTSFHLNIEKF